SVVPVFGIAGIEFLSSSRVDLSNQVRLPQRNHLPWSKDKQKQGISPEREMKLTLDELVR
ncbi:hypothetical protein, partial [Ferrovum sp.]|uniref:hypothetical protein n=1 Tax=Ferrovum sp. TaxID=2609467 RepID=UPI002627205C